MNRREFLKSAFAASSLAVLPAFLMPEYNKCKNDIVYFTNRHLLKNGSKLLEWQEKYLMRLAEGKSAILNGHRNCGKTVLAACYHIWKKVFFNENVGIVTTDTCNAHILCKMIESKIKMLPKDFTNALDMKYLHRFYVTHESVFNHIGIKGKGGYDFADCKSIIFDDFAFFKSQTESLRQALKCIEVNGENSSQIVYASTPLKKYDAFNFMCDAFINEDEGAYFEVSNTDVKII